MKKLTIVIAITVLLFSCKKTDVSNPSLTNQNSSIVSGTWTFSFDNNIEGGSINGYTKEYSLNNGYLLVGGNSNSSDATNPLSVLEFNLKMPVNGITVGTYFSNSDSLTYFGFQNALSVNPYGSNAYQYYSSSIYSKATMQINITSFNTTTKELTCTFSGYVQKDTAFFAINNGTISANYINN